MIHINILASLQRLETTGNRAVFFFQICQMIPFSNLGFGHHNFSIFIGLKELANITTALESIYLEVFLGADHESSQLYM